MRWRVLGLALSLGFAPADLRGQDQAPAPARTPAHIAVEQLTADARVPLALEPGGVLSPDAIWIRQHDAGVIVRIDAKTNQPDAPVAVGPGPCATLVWAFDSVWVPLCGGSGALVRVDTKTSTLAATHASGASPADGSMASAVGSLWMITDPKGVLSRVDPADGRAVAEVYVAAEPIGVAAGEGALWVTSQGGNVVIRIDPHTNEILETIAVGPRPGRVAVGEGAVWTLNRGDGSLTRVDPKVNKVVATIPLGEQLAGGDLAVGEGGVWISAPGVPLTRVDPRTNRVTHRFTGAAGGAVLVAHGSVWVAAAKGETWRLDPRLVSSMRPD